MATVGVGALRILTRSCTGNRFGCLRLNGLYRVPAQLSVIPNVALQSPTNSILTTQVASLSISPIRKAAPEIEQAGHDHVLHWTAERILSVVLLGSIPLTAILQTPSMEYFLALVLSVHTHWGIEAIVVDYIRPSVFGAAIAKLALGALYALSFLTLGGLCYFTYTDVGLVTAVKMLWKL